MMLNGFLDLLKKEMTLLKSWRIHLLKQIAFFKNNPLKIKTLNNKQIAEKMGSSFNHFKNIEI